MLFVPGNIAWFGVPHFWPSIKKHESRYSATWRANMISRKLHLFWSYAEAKALRKTLVDALPDNAAAQEKAVLKDAHFLETAAATGGRVVSKDATARNLFRQACPNLGSYKTILWGDLTGMPDAVVGWIEHDCADRNDFRLCPAAEKKLRKK